MANNTYYESAFMEHGGDASLQTRAAPLIKHRYGAFVKHQYPWERALIQHIDLVKSSLFNLKCVDEQHAVLPFTSS